MEDILIESLIYSAGIFNENLPNVSVTVPRLRLTTPILAYITGSPVDSDKTVREEHIFVLTVVNKRQIMVRCNDFIIQN